MARRPLLIVILAAAVAAGALFIGGGATGNEASSDGSLDLRQAPWLSQPDGSPAIDAVKRWPSAVFPPGVAYPDALEAVLRAAITGEPIRGAALEDPLPAEVVYVAPERPADGIRLSLTAPFGFDLERRAVRPPSVSLPSTLTPDEAMARVTLAREQGGGVPEGATIDVPALHPCQIAVHEPENRPACR